MSTPYVAPAWELDAFNCPFCGAFADQDHNWRMPKLDMVHGGDTNGNVVRTTICRHCGKYAIWHLDQMVYPDRGSAPLPSEDIPESVRRLYEEAAAISNKSPRAAAALLRLAIQHLCKELGEEGKNIYDDIGAFVAKGLNPLVQQSLDAVRVIGNNAVHPGQVDVDNPETVQKLFMLINFIVQQMITSPKQINAIYENDLPESSREQIERRDANSAESEPE